MVSAETHVLALEETALQVCEREIGDFLVSFGLEQDDLGALLEGVTARLRPAGFALRRMLIGSDYLHPVIGGISYRWRPETGVEESVWERTRMWSTDRGPCRPARVASDMTRSTEFPAPPDSSHRWRLDRARAITQRRGIGRLLQQTPPETGNASHARNPERG